MALVLAWCLAGSVSAATFCVRNATEFRAALTTAASNGEFDDIRLRTGSYYAGASAPFHLDINEPFGVKISGGWSALPGLDNCVLTQGDARSSVLDGMGSAPALTVWIFNKTVGLPVTVEALTLRNGRLDGGNGDGAGLTIAGSSEAAPLILVDRIIAEGNTGTKFASAVALSSNLVVRLTNSIVRSNTMQDNGAIHVHSNYGGVSLHGLTVLFNQRGTAGPAVEWQSLFGGGMTSSLVWGNTGGTDLAPSPGIVFLDNRYGTTSQPLTSPSATNQALAAPQLDALHRPAPGSPLRDHVWGFGEKDVYGGPRRINGWSDIGAAEGQ